MSSNKEFISLNERNVESIDISKVKTWLPLQTVTPSHGNDSVGNRKSRKWSSKKIYKKKSSKLSAACNPYPLKMESRKTPDYLNYVRTQRSPAEQQKLAQERELLTIMKQQTKNFISLDHPRHSFNYNRDEILQIPSPNVEGDLRPKPASQNPSQILPYIQSQTLIELQAPKTGISLHPQPSSQLPIETKHFPASYDPRQLQQELDAMNDKFYVYDKKGNWYAIPASSRRKSSLKPVQKLIVKKIINTPPTNTCAMITKPKQCKTLADIKLNLGFPVGIELGSFGIHDAQFSDKIQGKQGFACCLFALGYTFVKPERKWDTKVLDNIIIDGTALYERSLDENGKSNEFLMREFQIGDVRIEVEHGLPSVQGELRSDDSCCADVYRGLSKCLKKGRFMIFRCRKRTLLIWKKYGYFIYDPIGRTKECHPGTQSALITVKNVENVAHIIVNLSNLNGNPTYTLTDVKINKLTSPTHNTIKSTPVMNPNPGYQTINAYRAILRSPFHLRHTCFNESGNHQSMSMSTTALIFGKIDPSSTWTDKHLHKIMLIGDELYKNWSGNQTKHLDLKDLPKNFQFGQYAVTLKLFPFYSDALIKDEKNEVQVFHVITDALKEHRRLLLQVSHMFFAVWEKNQIYYLFDPYPRNEEGDVCIDKYGQCCISMFSFIEELCRVFRRNILQIVPDEKLYVHVIEIEELNQIPDDEVMITSKPIIQIMNDDSDEVRDEVKSLVDSVDFVIQTSGTRVLDVTNEDRVLILDSPSASVTQLHQEDCHDLHKNQKPLTKETIVSDTSLARKTISKDVSPSIDYLCAAEAYKFIDDLQDKLPIDRACHKNSDTIESHSTSCSNGTHITAARVLLKSDLGQLKQERDRIKHEPVSLPHEDCICHDPMISLSQELLIPSNFTQLPDGSSIIFGTKDVFNVKDDVTPEHILPIIAVASVICSYKYSIATWNTNIMDFVLEMSREMASNIESMNFFLVANHNFPLMEIGSRKYDVRMKLIEMCVFKNLCICLERLFLKLGKLVILSPASSIAVFKRKNFFYLYEAYPCNGVGLRSDTGHACFIRFKSLSSMIRRIEANRREFGLDDSILLSQVILKEVSEASPYPCPTESQEEAFIKNAQLEHVYRDYKKQQQLEMINAMIEQERERIKNFRKLKPHEIIDSETSKDAITSVDNPLSNDRSQIKDPQLKPNKKYTTLQTYKIPPLNPKPVTGYKQRDQDLLWKVQGSTALPNRCGHVTNQIKPCHFSSVYALLFVMHHPIEKWNHRKIDLCIEHGLSLYEKISTPSISLTRDIENLQIENMIYNIVISSCDTNLKSQTVPLRKSLVMNFQRHNYLILQFPNCSFGLYKDQLYHVFDSYPSVEYCEPLSKEELEDLESRRANFNGTLNKEENKASWILCISVDDILDYVSKRVDRSKMKTEYLLYRINIINYRKAPSSAKISYLMYKSIGQDLSFDMICGVSVEPKLPNEEIGFLEKVGVPPWSRLESCNAEKKRRGTSQTTWKEYDIEITHELYSLWGDLSPNSTIFKENAGKQYLSINCIALAMSLLYPLDEWNTEIINSIVIHGNRFFTECIESNVSLQEFEFCHLNSEYELDHISLQFKYKPVVYGVLYDSDPHKFNLSRALTYFFRDNNYGILSIFGRAIAIGKEKSYFMFDCQSFGSPLFMKNQGAAYVLRCCSLRRLLECILLTLNVDRYCVRFVLHAVEVHIGEESVGGDDDEDEEIDENIEKPEKTDEEIKETDESSNEPTTNDQPGDEVDENNGPEWISGDTTRQSSDQGMNNTRLSKPYVAMIDPRI